jgi:STE24 endopeptidase
MVIQLQTSPPDTVAVPEPSALAIQYHRSGNVLWAAETSLGLIIPAALLFSGLSARMRSLSNRVGRRWFLILLLYGVLFTVLIAILTLPLSFYAGYIRQHEYGLSNQSLGAWAGDWIKGVALGGMGLAAVLWIPYLLLRRNPRRWWLYAGIASLPLTALLLVITPVWVDPLFNDYEPMENKPFQDSSPGAKGGDRRQSGVSSRQELGYETGERVCYGDRRHEADRALGHSSGKTQGRRDPVRNGT